MVIEKDNSNKDLEQKLFDAINRGDADKVEHLIKEDPKLNLNCLDKDELTPLQLACHKGLLQVVSILIDNNVDVNFSKRKDAYTSLMFAAIGGREAIVRLLLEKGADTTVENCVKRTASDMAAFVGQPQISALISCWISYEDSIKPYTKPRELEDKPRIPSDRLGRLLHDYIVYPTSRAKKLLVFIMERPELVEFEPEFSFVLEDLSSKSLKPPINDECLSFKYYYLTYLLQQCRKHLKLKQTASKGDTCNETFDKQACSRSVETLIRRLIKRKDPSKNDNGESQQLNQFLIECLMKYPYTQTGVFKTMSFALSKCPPEMFSAQAVLTESINVRGPRQFGRSEDACAVCGEGDRNKKCASCKEIYYCGTSCQKIDWFQHKKACRA